MLNNKFTYIFGLLILSALLLSSSATSNEIVVSTTIQDAVDAANPGDTVIIPNGTYKGACNKKVNITNKNLNIIGNNSSGDVVIDAEGTDRIFYITNSNVNIFNLNMLNIKVRDNGDAVYYGPGSSGSVINCISTKC